MRDDAVKSLGAVLAGYAALPIAARKEAAAPLKAVWDKYARAGITTANYTSESSMIESMLEDFGAEALAGNVTALEGVAEAIAAVREAQDGFTRANDEYVRASVNRGASASAYKKPLLSLINDKLVPYLNAMVIAGNADCAEFAKSVEAEINRTNAAVGARKGRKAAETDPAVTE